MNQKKLIITSIIVYFIAATGAYLGTTAIASSSTKSASSNKMVEPTVSSEPLTEECPINGQMYGKSAKAKWEKRRPLGVVIENHAESRPQSGISSADVVYEAVAEGGVTRTLDIYYCQDAKTVGPVRSARVHFVNLLREWGNNPLYAHVGGANCDATTGSGCGNGAPADALGLIVDIGWGFYNDLNQFAIPYPYFYRDYDRLPGVATEHTMYSSTAKLWEYAAKNRELTNVDEEGVSWSENWVPWTFVDDAEANARGKETPISYDFYDTNVSEFGVRWEYDAVSNTYKRFNGGKPHIDFNTDKQLTAKNVIVIEARESSANDDYPGGHIVYKLTGSGPMYAFQNGEATEGTWEKETLDSKMIFLDSAGKELSIVRGNVWISLIPEGNEVSYGSKAKSVEGKQGTTMLEKPSTVSE
ncbi:DUF3048 domain-containing protein [Candidatus Woesebacteria bacterium]|nr:DUF3048 domain-containing protein [Candidatus Woesebacteria bacterium]